MTPYQAHLNYLLENCKAANINLLMRMTGISYSTLERLRDGRNSTIAKERLDQILELTLEDVDDFAKTHDGRRAITVKPQEPEKPEKPKKPKEPRVQRLSSPAVEEILRRKKEAEPKKPARRFPKGVRASQRDTILYCLEHGGTYQSIAKALGTTAGNILNIANGNSIPQTLRARISANMDKLEALLKK